jgi:hypothetical protein
MKRYWDYSEQERAELTAEQVEKLLAYELMEQGVLVVEPLRVEEIQEIKLPTRRVFMLSEAQQYSGTTSLNIGFETIEQAESARDAIRFVRESPWNGTAHVRPVRALTIASEELPDETAVAAAKAVLDENTRRSNANATARREHEEACKKVADATSGIWSDWHDCRRVEARHQKIRDTLADYVRMTDGDAAMARAFLGKAFPADEIEAALGPQATDDVADKAA